MNQKQWNIGAIAILLMILFISGLMVVLNGLRSKPGSVGHREPLPAFGYCSSSRVRPCILSVALNPDGSMSINILVKRSSQNFYIKIRDETNQYIYECKRVPRGSIYVTCRGEAIPVGEMAIFTVITKKKNTTLAGGSFSIIGMALVTPEIPTPTLTPTFVPAFDHPPR